MNTQSNGSEIEENLENIKKIDVENTHIKEGKHLKKDIYNKKIMITKNKTK